MDEQRLTEIRAEAAYQRYRAKGTDRRGGRLGPNTVPKPYTPPELPSGEINTTDPDSRMVKGQHGFLQGYNAQAAATANQIVIAAEIEVVSPDFGHLERTVSAARRELEAAGVTERPGVVLADSGYWHSEQIQRLTGAGIPVLIRPTPGSEPPRGRAGAAASMTSSATCSPPNTAKRSTSNDNTSSSRSSPTPNTTAASADSTAAAEPPSAPNGA